MQAQRTCDKGNEALLFGGRQGKQPVYDALDSHVLDTGISSATTASRKQSRLACFVKIGTSFWRHFLRAIFVHLESFGLFWMLVLKERMWMVASITTGAV